MARTTLLISSFDPDDDQPAYIEQESEPDPIPAPRPTPTRAVAPRNGPPTNPAPCLVSSESVLPAELLAATTREEAIRALPLDWARARMRMERHGRPQVESYCKLPTCGRPIKGDPSKDYCDGACRVAAYRLRKRCANSVQG